MLRKFAKSANVSKSAKPKMREARSEGFKNTDACNNSIETKSKSSDFIFFGCWNNINCKKEYVYRDIVLDYISLNENAIKQLYIAGDNWYTNERKIGEVNYKVYLTDVLTTGYAKLYAMKKDVYIAVGNHDEDKDGDKGHTLLKKDCNIHTQKYYLRQINEGKLREEAMPPTLNELHLLALGNQFADNSMCEKGIYIYVDDIGVRYNNGNIVIIINTNRFDDYTTGLKYLGSIKAVIKRVENAKTTEQIFVMGHIPLFDFKPDKTGNGNAAKAANADQIKLHKINKKEERYDKIILKLFDLFAVHNIVYICADTHNFSIMRIQRENSVVIQITAGTGGADPDLLQTEYAVSPYYVDDGIFNITAYALNPYGYVKIKMEENKRIKVCYTQIIKIKDEKDKTSQVGVLPKTNVFTYRVDMNTKTFDDTSKATTTAKATATAKSISDMEVYMSNKQKVCSHPTAGYITNLKSDVVCYKKNKNK